MFIGFVCATGPIFLSPHIPSRIVGGRVGIYLHAAFFVV